ncbi:alpha/beta fold hydrolase, partial [Acinetobacter baumannii]
SMVEEITRQGIKDAEANFCNEQFIKKLAKFHGDKAEWVLRAWIDTWLSPAFRNWNIDAYISKIKSPLLVIHGENDEYATLIQPERLIQLSNGYKELEILKDCGHFPHKEKETEVLTTIQSFLEKI